MDKESLLTKENEFHISKISNQQLKALIWQLALHEMKNIKYYRIQKPIFADVSKDDPLYTYNIIVMKIENYKTFVFEASQRAFSDMELEIYKQIISWFSDLIKGEIKGL